jgi:hypothetical protein
MLKEAADDRADGVVLDQVITQPIITTTVAINFMKEFMM